MQPKFSSVAKEWRSGNLIHRSTSHPHGERDLLLKSKDRGKRSEANDREAEHSSAGKGSGFPGNGVPRPFYPFLVCIFRSRSSIGVSSSS